MTAPIRTPSDRDRILDNAAETIRYLTSPPHTIHLLRQHIADRVPDGLRSASYDGEEHRPSAEVTTAVERIALDPHARIVAEDLAAVDDALRAIATGVEVLHRLTHEYPIHEPARGLTDRTVGKGIAPVGSCQVCWAYGRQEFTDIRYKRFCRWCGDERAKLGGRRPPREIWEVHRQGRRVTLAHYRRLAPDLVPLLRAG